MSLPASLRSTCGASSRSRAATNLRYASGCSVTWESAEMIDVAMTGISTRRRSGKAMGRPRLAATARIRTQGTMPRRYELVSADSHVLEPPDLWTQYLPARFHAKAPRVVPDGDGGEAWQFAPDVP